MQWGATEEMTSWIWDITARNVGVSLSVWNSDGHDQIMIDHTVLDHLDHEARSIIGTARSQSTMLEHDRLNSITNRSLTYRQLPL